jgi:hypothetical protein
MIEQLGDEPAAAPKTISGSREADHFHLLFQFSALASRSKFTPWHNKLEFRGEGALVVLPGSMHPSGQKYRWAPGRSPWDLSLPPIPSKVLKALAEPRQPRPIAQRNVAVADQKRIGGDPTKRLSPLTRRFLTGEFAEGPRWNDRLYAAACDMCARAVPIEEATPLLLEGAKPWRSSDLRMARATIQSAFSGPREPAKS